MYDLINYVNEDISLGSPFEISFQSFFERAQKAGSAIQELNNLVVTILLAALNSLPSLEYLWSVLQRLAIFIPYVIYSQYKQYKLEKRIYELTWTLSYQLRKDMFKVVTPQSKTSFRRSSSCIIKQTEFSSPMSSFSTSSAPGRPRRRSVLQIGDTPIETRIHRNKSSPVLFRRKGKLRRPIVNLLEITPHEPQERFNDSATIPANKFSSSHGFQADSQSCASWKPEDGDKNMENTCLVPMNPTKKLKRDTEDNKSTTASRYSTSIVRRIFQTPQVSLHHTFTVCCNVFSKKGATKSPSGISQDVSTSTSQTKQYMVSNDSTVSCEQRKSRIGDGERKWRRILERSNNIRNERLAKMKETELQKLQEREKAKKAEMTRRRAMIAKIREQNRKLLMEQRGMNIDDSEDCNNEIVLPVVRVKPIDSISNQAAAFQEHAPSVGDMVGQVPVVRVTQKTFTIERTAKISKFDNERGYNMMETKMLHMGGVGTKPADQLMLRNVVKEKPGQRNLKNSEYYLLTKETPSNKQFLYVKMSPNSGVTPSDTSFANKSVSEIYPRPIKKYGDVRQVRSNLQKNSKNSNSLFPWSPAIQCEDLNQNIKLSSSDSPGSVTSGLMPTNAMLSRPPCQVMGTNELEKFTSAENQEDSDHEETISNKDVSGGEIIENVVSPSGDGVDTKFPKPATPPRRYDVEAPPSPAAFCDSKGRRPVIKRVRRRLQKELDKPVYTENRTLQPKPTVVSDSVSLDTAQIKDLVQHSEEPTKPKPKDAKVDGPKSLLLKKIELRKRLEESRRAITCRNPPINDSTSAGTEKKGNDDQSLESRSGSPINSNERPAPVNKPRRFSFDGTASKTKLGQSRAPPSTNRFKKCLTRKVNPPINTMKKGSPRCKLYRQGQVDSLHDGKEPEGQEKPKAPTPRANLNRTITATPDRRKPPVVRPNVVHTTIDGTHCRNKLGSPVNRRLYKENSVTKPDPSENAPDVAYDKKTATPVTVNVTNSQENDNNLTQSSDDNFPSFLSLAGGSEESPPPEEMKTEMKQLNESYIDGKTDSETVDSSKSKRSDFLAFEMDASGHPVPVNHSKDRSSRQRPQPFKQQEKRRSSVAQGNMRKSSVLKKMSSKRCLKNEEPIKSQGTVDEKEWNKRMKTWEKKRKQLVSGRKSSQDVWRKSLSRHRLSYRTMESENRHCENREVEARDAAASEEIISSKEYSENVNKNGSNQGNNKNTNKERRQIEEENREILVERRNVKEENGAANNETASGYVKNEYLTRKNGNDKEQMARIHSSPCASSPCASSLVQANHLGSTHLPLKLGSQEERQSKKSGDSRRSDSVGLAKNSNNSQGKEDQNPEMTSNSPKGGLLLENPEFSKSVLSPIQSVSDNNYNSDSAPESNGQLQTLNIKQQNGDSYNIEPAKPFDNQVENSPGKPELKEEEGSVKNELLDSCLNSSVANKLPPKEHTEYSENTGLVQLESGTQKIHDMYRIDYPQDSEKENEAELKSSSQARRKSTLSGLALDSEANFRKDEREERDETFKVVGEPRRNSTSACRKSKDISVILDDLLTVTKALKEEHISREFRKNHSRPRVCDGPNDRTALSAIVCCPEGSSVDDIGSLPGMPVFLDPSFTQKRIMNPVVVECVASTPAEFYQTARETNDRFLTNGQNDGQKMTTRIEWYEDLYKPPISSEELDTHHDVEVKSYKEIVVDRRRCKSKNEGVCTAGYEQRKYKVRRYEVLHDSSNCYINNTKRRSHELSHY